MGRVTLVLIVTTHGSRNVHCDTGRGDVDKRLIEGTLTSVQGISTESFNTYVRGV